MSKASSIWIGFDPREGAAFAVARASARRRLTIPIPIHGLVLDDLRTQGLYWRGTEIRRGRLWDVPSQAPMSTEFANSRFLVPHLARTGWALFMDCDMLVRANLAELFRSVEFLDYAVMCVKHRHEPEPGIKMDGQVQTRYACKNWSSFVLFNCDHPSNQKLTLELVNTLPGRDLHRFCWLDDSEIGELGAEWNYLVGHSRINGEPKVVHHTDGSPCMDGFHDVPYAAEWRGELARWAA